MANLFMMFTLLEGAISKSPIAALRFITLTRSRLCRTRIKNAKKITLLQDNLNTHKPASLYQAFLPDKVRRLVERFEWHYKPKHGSWLNWAESERGILASQCLDRRVVERQNLETEIAAWEGDRNEYHTKANWQFTTEDALIKLKHLYPTF